MIRFLLAVVAATGLTACNMSSPNCAAPDAKSIVQAIGARRVLRDSLMEISRTTMTGRIVAKQDPSGFEARLSAAVTHAVDRHGAEWEAGMVSAYASTLSPEELQATCSAINNGDKGTFMRFANRVGAELKARTGLLLNSAGAEVLQELFEGSAST
jgi:hypothetical protein